MPSVAVVLDSSGISVKSFREVRNSVAAKFKSIFGENIDTTPSSPDGQLIDLFVYAYHDAALAIQGGLANLDVDSAQGTFLDNIGRIMGVDRNGMDDETYRSVLQTTTRQGLATFDAMQSYLSANLNGMVSLVENTEPTPTPDGIPGHSVAVYVPDSVVATDDEIAQLIWNCKPAGIKTHGTESGTAKDLSQNPHDVKFSRITQDSPFYMKITITEYTEEYLPADFAGEVKRAVADWALQEYTPGKDVIPKRAIQAVYKVQGIDDVTILVSADGSEYTADRIPVDMGHYAYLPESNITVIKAS